MTGRSSTSRLSRTLRLRGLLVVLILLGLVVPACGASMASDRQSDCPHCPPAPCHETAPADCGDTDPLEKPRTSDFKPVAVLPAFPHGPALNSAAGPKPPAARLALARAGPPLHLLLSRFRE